MVAAPPDALNRLSAVASTAYGSAVNLQQIGSRTQPLDDGGLHQNYNRLNINEGVVQYFYRISVVLLQDLW